MAPKVDSNLVRTRAADIETLSAPSAVSGANSSAPSVQPQRAVRQQEPPQQQQQEQERRQPEGGPQWYRPTNWRTEQRQKQQVDLQRYRLTNSQQLTPEQDWQQLTEGNGLVPTLQEHISLHFPEVVQQERGDHHEQDLDDEKDGHDQGRDAEANGDEEKDDEKQDEDDAQEGAWGEVPTMGIGPTARGRAASRGHVMIRCRIRYIVKVLSPRDGGWARIPASFKYRADALECVQIFMPLIEAEIVMAIILYEPLFSIRPALASFCEAGECFQIIRTIVFNPSGAAGAHRRRAC
jgi:hypothetical protein